MWDISRIMFVAQALGLLVACVTWVKFRNRLCPGWVFVPFLLLAIMVMDSGLMKLLWMIGWITGVEQPWPPPNASWQTIYRILPLVLAAACTVWIARGVWHAHFPRSLTVASCIVIVTALVQGMVNLRWFNGQDILEIITSHPLDPPWTHMRAATPGVLVLLALCFLVAGQAKPAEGG